MLVIMFAIPNPWVSSLLHREWGQLPAAWPAHLLQRGPGALPDRGPLLFQGMAAGENASSARWAADPFSPKKC